MYMHYTNIKNAQKSVSKIVSVNQNKIMKNNAQNAKHFYSSIYLFSINEFH